jgi:ectoine hydroxylase-related dioxygenase (phytanoyl-CoA dioxygenase family)
MQGPHLKTHSTARKEKKFFKDGILNRKRNVYFSILCKLSGGGCGAQVLSTTDNSESDGDIVYTQQVTTGSSVSMTVVAQCEEFTDDLTYKI